MSSKDLAFKDGGITCRGELERLILSFPFLILVSAEMLSLSSGCRQPKLAGSIFLVDWAGKELRFKLQRLACEGMEIKSSLNE